ncbi:MAG: DMT family transporter [Rhodoferax sp.]|nr:DMT family transporter [Rhodoferax sp.]
MVTDFRSPLRGVVFVVLACACFAILDSVSKMVVASVPVLMAIWARYVMQALFTTAMLTPRYGRALVQVRHPWLQLTRGLLLAGTTLLALLALRFMPVGEFTAIVMLTPLAGTVLAVFIFKERVVPLQWLCVIGGFAGAMVIIRPGSGQFGWAALLALGCMAGATTFQLLTSHMARLREHPAATHFFSGWTGALVLTLALPLTWAPVDSAQSWLLMALMGVLAAGGHFMLTLGYQYASAVTLMPYLYCQVGFAVIAGMVFFDHAPDGASLAGMALVSCCGAASAWLTAQRRRLPALGQHG